MLPAHNLVPGPDVAIHAFSAPVAPAAVLAREAVVSWTSSELTVVGIGIARELRGRGATRWTDLVAAARAVVIDDSATIDGAPCGHRALGAARPRFLGGAAFAPGAADRAPWHGFGDAWFVLPRWSYVVSGGRAMLVLAAEPGDDLAVHELELARLRAVLAHASTSRAPQPALVELQPAPAGVWRQQVTAITEAIAAGECSKVVAARTCNVLLAGAIDVGALLLALDERHPDCVRAMVRPAGAALVAATPERLVRVDGRTVTCDALAGTTTIRAMPFARDAAGRLPAETASHGEAELREAARARLLASAKDRREHHLVVEAIRRALEDAGATIESDLTAPGVRALRHVLHLHTPFRATLAQPRHVLELAARLHPTPAVGGTPTAQAIDWIAAREPVARGWYASPIGWFDGDGNGELAVAIRSGVIADNRAHLWAGAGIVAGSDPDRELAETDAKLRAMLGALGIGGAR